MPKEDKPMTTIVTQPTSGAKVEAVRAAINFKRLQLDALRSDSVDRFSVTRHIESLEAILLDYQPENRVRLAMN